MAEVERKASDDNEENIMPVQTQGVLEDSDNSATVTHSVREGQESDNTEGGKKQGEINPKEQELPELIRHKHESKGMMPCLPSINLLELTTILRDPNMPSQKILNEVADKIMSKSEESESDDGSVSSGGGVVGMKGLLDCIFEVSYMHEDSDSSDDDDGSFERFPREIPCTFCNKIFGSTMTWNTHVLVAHPHQEHSVHNIRKTSVSESDRKEKAHPHRKYLRGSSKSECDARDIKVYYASAAKMKQVSECNKNVTVHKRHSSLSKSQYREGDKCDYKLQISTCQLKNESLSNKEVSCSISPCGLIQQGEEVATSVCQNKSVESGATSVAPCQALDKISTVEGESVKCLSASSSQLQGAESTYLNPCSSEVKDEAEVLQSSAAASEAPCQALDKISTVEGESNECLSASSSSQLRGVESTCLNPCSSGVKDEAKVLQSSGADLDAHAPANSSDHAGDLSANSKFGRKRKTRAELPESTSASSLSPKRSRKTISKD